MVEIWWSSEYKPVSGCTKLVIPLRFKYSVHNAYCIKLHNINNFNFIYKWKRTTISHKIIGSYYRDGRVSCCFRLSVEFSWQMFIKWNKIVGGRGGAGYYNVRETASHFILSYQLVFFHHTFYPPSQRDNVQIFPYRQSLSKTILTQSTFCCYTRQGFIGETILRSMQGETRNKLCILKNRILCRKIHYATNESYMHAF